MANKLLIVEDETEAVEILTEFFSELGFEVQSANNGQDGLALFKSFKPRLVILDMKMPHMNGEKFLDLLRQDEDGKKVDVIVTTGYADGGLTHDRIDHYQVKAYLEKPVSLDQLEEAVKALKL
jgi:DNA-binding response OmpR family regulator